MEREIGNRTCDLVNESQVNYLNQLNGIMKLGQRAANDDLVIMGSDGLVNQCASGPDCIDISHVSNSTMKSVLQFS